MGVSTARGMAKLLHCATGSSGVLSVPWLKDYGRCDLFIVGSKLVISACLLASLTFSQERPVNVAK